MKISEQREPFTWQIQTELHSYLIPKLENGYGLSNESIKKIDGFEKQ